MMYRLMLAQGGVKFKISKPVFKPDALADYVLDMEYLVGKRSEICWIERVPIPTVVEEIRHGNGCALDRADRGVGVEHVDDVRAHA